MKPVCCVSSGRPGNKGIELDEKDASALRDFRTKQPLWRILLPCVILGLSGHCGRFFCIA